ncbi:hypothetical protein pb186bvf_017774 [Paramecium bursaria]
MSFEQIIIEEESKQKCHTCENMYNCDICRRENQKQLSKDLSQLNDWTTDLQKMQNLTQSILQTLEQQKTQFELLYEQVKMLVMRKSESIKKQLFKYSAEFESRQNSKIYDNSLQNLLALDISQIDPFRLEFEKLNQHLELQGIQQNQIIQILDTIHLRETKNVFKFQTHSSEGQLIKNIKGYEELQKQEFNISRQIFLKGGVESFDISKDWQYLAVSQSLKQLVIWDLMTDIKLFEHKHQKQISAIRISNDKSQIYFGDESGLVSCLLLSAQISWQNQVHNKQVYYIQEIQKNQIITSSQDNRIILTDISSTYSIWIINYICPCFSGFDISENNQLIVAPNSKAFSIWNVTNGQEVTKFEYFMKENRFIQVLFSQNMNYLLVGLGQSKTVLMFDLLHPEVKLQLRKEILFRAFIYNISWCFSDKVMLVNSERCFQFRTAEDAQLIKEYLIYEPYYLLHKQEQKGERIIFSHSFKMFICKRAWCEIKQ